MGRSEDENCDGICQLGLKIVCLSKSCGRKDCWFVIGKSTVDETLERGGGVVDC